MFTPNATTQQNSLVESDLVMRTCLKAKTESYGLLKRLTDSTFIACIQTVLYLFGHVKALSSKLQRSTLDVVTAYKMVEHVRYILANERVHDDTAFNNVYKKMLVMAKIASLPSIEPPRRYVAYKRSATMLTQIPRSNISNEQYFFRF